MEYWKKWYSVLCEFFIQSDGYEDQQTTTKSFLRYLQDIIFPNVFVCNTETIIMLLPDREHFREANVNNLLPYSDLKND